MRKYLLIVLCLTVVMTSRSQYVIEVQKDNAQSLLDAIAQANQRNADKSAECTVIMIPDGYYDLGETVLTRITGHHIALVGQSMEGTVDFICGAGDVWFERCRIVTEKRTVDGSGRNVIAAPRTSKTPWGYIFHGCTVENVVSNFEYARGWKDTPHCIWLNTTLLTPEKLNKTRFDYRGMRTVQNDFKEYGTKDARGRDITPKSNVVTFETQEATHTTETILSQKEARKYTVKNVFPDWRPDKVVRLWEKRINACRR